MSGQLSLFDIEEKKPDDIVDVITTKKKVKKPKPKENTAEDVVVEMKTAESDKYGWGTLPKHEIWKSEGIDYVNIDLFSQSDLSGIKYSAHHHYAHENPNNMLGSSWGGGGCFNPSNLCEIKEVFDEILQHKKRNLQEKYRVFTDAEQTGTSLVADFQKDGKSLSYNPFYMAEYVSPLKWTRIQCAFYLPRTLPPGSIIKLYFYVPKTTLPFFIDDMSMDFLSLKDEIGYQRLEGVILPKK